MGNHPHVVEQLKAADERTYERVWELPLIKSRTRRGGRRGRPVLERACSSTS